MISSSRPVDWQATAQNTLLLGTAVAYLFGPAAALTCAAVNVLFSQLGEPRENWFPLPDGKVVSQIKEIWRDNHFFKIELVLGVALRALGVGVNQVAILAIRNSFGHPLKMLQIIARACLLAPLIEETIFRGFLQEKMEQVQVYLVGKEEAHTDSQSTIRVLAQSILFGFMHYHPSQGKANQGIVAATAVTGFLIGEVKEEKRNLWSTCFLHAYINSAVVMRVFLFGV